MSKKRIVIIGSGIVGTACAHYLSRDGHDVTVVDRKALASGSSHGNCGYLVYGHVLPLTEPGAVMNTLKAMGQRNSPFYVKPRVDPKLWMWLLKFAVRCNAKNMMSAAKVRSQLLHSSAALYEELMQQFGEACEFERQGNLFVYKDDKAWQAYGETDAILREHFDEPATKMDGGEMVAFEPALREGLAGGWFYENECHLDPAKLLAAWQAKLAEQGVTWREHCSVESIQQRGDQAVGVMTEQGEIEADTVVVAAGAESPVFQKQLQCRIPIQPGKGYSITMPRPAICPKVAMLLQQHRVGVTPFKTSYRLGSTMEFSGYDDSINEKRLALLTDGAAHYLTEPLAEPVEETWAGWRPMTYDDLPIIDRSPAMSNVLIAAGLGMMGLTLGPVTGKLISELVGQRPPHVDVQSLRVGRFS